MKDEAIITLMYDKDEYGLICLREKYEKLLIYIASGILGSRNQDVEECVNDTYLKIWNHAEQFDMNKASLKTYLKVIVRNTAINKLRDLSRREEKELSADVSELALSYVDYTQNVEKKIIGKEDIKRLNEVIEGLNKKDRELVIRKYFYLQSSKDISKAMKMTVTAIDSRLSRLRSKMKQEFQSEFGFLPTRKGVINE